MTDNMKYIPVRDLSVSESQMLHAAYKEMRKIFNGLDFGMVTSEVNAAKEYTMSFRGANQNLGRVYSIHTLGKSVYDTISTDSVCLSIESKSGDTLIKLFDFDLLNLRHIHNLAALVMDFELCALPVDLDIGEYAVQFTSTNAELVRSIPEPVALFAKNAGLDINDGAAMSAILTLYAKGYLFPSMESAKTCDLDIAQACADDFVTTHLFYPEFFKGQVRRIAAQYNEMSVPAYTINFKSIFDAKSLSHRKLVDRLEEAFLVFALLPYLTEEGPQLTLAVDTGCHHKGEGYPYVDLGESETISLCMTSDFKLDSPTIVGLSALFFERARLAVQDAASYMDIKYSMKSLVAQFKE